MAQVASQSFSANAVASDLEVAEPEQPTPEQPANESQAATGDNCTTAGSEKLKAIACLPSLNEKNQKAVKMAASAEVPEHGLAARIGAATAVLAFYTGIGTTSYFWWYKGQEHSPFRVENEGWFGPETYAGGTDKLGHLFSNYAMSRTAADLLQVAGMKKLPASLTANALTLIFFTGIEIKDGLHKGYGFSWGDMAANIAGNVLASVMINFPEVDEMFDYRLEYFPSAQYRSGLSAGNPNMGEDYTGMHYAVWYHLASLAAVKEAENPILKFLRYVDVGVGYHTENFKPEPTSADALQKQQLFLGLTFNLQTVTDDLFFNRGETKSAMRSVTQSLTEFFTVPFTALHLGPTIESPQNNRD